MKRNLLTTVAIIAILGAVFLLGCFVGKWSSHENAEPDTAQLNSTGLAEQEESVADQESELPVEVKGNPLENLEDLFSDLTPSDFRRVAEKLKRYRYLQEELLDEWMKQDPKGALEFAIGTVQRHRLIRELAKTQPDFAFSWVRNNVVSAIDRNVLIRDIYQGIAMHDPAEALRRLEEQPAGVERTYCLKKIVAEWAKQDIHAVFNWLETTEPNRASLDIYNQTMKYYYNAHPEEAAEFLPRWGLNENEKERIVRYIGEAFATKDIQGALSWAESLQDKDSKQYAIIGILEIWAQTGDPNEVLNFAMTFPDHTKRSSPLSRAVGDITMRDPDLVLNAMATMSDTDLLNVTPPFAERFAYVDSARFIDWMSTLEPGALRDRTISSVHGTFLSADNPYAFALAETVVDEQKRLSLIRRSTESWYNFSPTKAEAALAATTVISEEQKQKILTGLHKKQTPRAYALPSGAQL